MITKLINQIEIDFALGNKMRTSGAGFIVAILMFLHYNISELPNFGDVRVTRKPKANV